MKLSDLKTGMVVKMKDGDKFLIVNKYLIGSTNHMLFESYNEDMTNRSGYECFDIVKVWTLDKMCSLNIMLLRPDWLLDNGHLIWDRENGDCVDMTLEEVCKALGKNVRIVKEK